MVKILLTSTYCFSLPGITCANCVKPVEEALKACKTIPIEQFAVEIVEKKLTVIVINDERPPEEIRRRLEELLQDIGVDSEFIDLKPMLPPDSLWSSIKNVLLSHWVLGSLGVSVGAVFLLLMMFMPVVPMAGMIAMAAISIPLTLALGAESYQDAAKKLVKTRALTMDTLFTISTLTVITVSIAAFFFPWLPMLFDAGLLIFGFRHIGFGIEDSIKQAIGLEARFKDRAPSKVKVWVDGKETEQVLENIMPGDVLILQPGDMIPLDGSCEEACDIFDTIVTGSMLGRQAAKGESLLAGMSLLPGGDPVHFRVSAGAKESYLARLDDSLERAHFEKAPLETATNKTLQYFIPAVIIFAIVSLLVIGHFFTLALAIQCAIAVLVSACPCTLGFITPLAVKIGMNKAAEYGVQFKSAKTMQEAEQIDSVVFDLNGTLTLGMPVVRRYSVLPDMNISTHELLSYFFLLEKERSHPIAKAICQYTQDHHISPPKHWETLPIKQSNHSGVAAVINGESYVLGNQHMMNEIGIKTLNVPSNEQLEAGDTVVYLARGKTLLGYMILADKLRPNAKYTIESLRALGKEVYLCTGADEATAYRYAKTLDIPLKNVQAGCMGAEATPPLIDKISYIDQLKQQGQRVAMVGDAANDALAIAMSDFGIAVKSQGADEMTLQQAGAVIQSGSLLPVVNTFAIAKQTVDNVKQNLWLSLGYNIGAVLLASGLLLTIGLVLNPGVGVMLMILQTALVLYSAYCFKNKKLTHLEHLEEEPEYPLGTYHQLTSAMPSLGMKPSLSNDDKSSHQVTIASGSLFEKSENQNHDGLALACTVLSNGLL